MRDAVAVLDIGKTNVKVVCFDDAGDDLYVDNDGKKAVLRHKLDLVHPELDGPGGDPKAKFDDYVFRIYRAVDAECAFDKK